MRSRRGVRGVALVIALLATPALEQTAAAVAGPALSVDVSAARKPINRDIYGMNYPPAGLASELQIPIWRWGGTARSRYDWTVPAQNAGGDYFFFSDQAGSFDDFVSSARTAGGAVFLQMPALSWVGRLDGPNPCSFPVSEYGAQTATDGGDCGNGIKADGNDTRIIADPTRANRSITPAWATQWIDHLKVTFGTAAQGGVRHYDIDQEPAIWHEPIAHMDVHPKPATGSEMVMTATAWGPVMKTADPSAFIHGPGEYNYEGYIYSGSDREQIRINPAITDDQLTDRASRGGTPLLPWYLAQLSAYEQNTGNRILDYLDVHYYPESNGGEIKLSSDPGDAAIQERRLRATRSLWDPTYVDESFIADFADPYNKPQVIRRLKQWVADNYPGTKVSIGEYNFGGEDGINGAVAQADLLGIFGREGTDMALLWPTSGFTASDPLAFAFRMYLRYDGGTGAFGDTSVQATSADQGILAVYAAQRSSDGALTMMVVNKSLDQSYESPITISNFTPGGPAQVWRYSSANLAAIVRDADIDLSASTPTFPAQSMTLLVVPPEGVGTPRTFLFAEGTTRPGFAEYLALANTRADAPVTGRVTYQFGQATPRETFTRDYTVGPQSTRLVDVGAETGPGFDLSLEVGEAGATTGGLVAERQVYFEAGPGPVHWTGFHDQVGTPAAATTWFFGEGTTLPAFTEYLTLQNPDPAAPTTVRLTYQPDRCARAVAGPHTMTLPPASRTTIEVANPTAPFGVGGAVCVGLGAKVEVTSGPAIVAERPLYFTQDFGSGLVADGHDSFGASAPGTLFYFAEGTSLPGFNEYLTLAAPGSAPADVTIDYQDENGTVTRKTVSVGAGSRSTVEVFNESSPGGLGPGRVGISARLSSTQPIVAERAQYLVRDVGSGVTDGGHVAQGARAPSVLASFADGSTAPGIDTFLTVQNVDPSRTAALALTVLGPAGLLRTATRSVGPNTRATFRLSEPDLAGAGVAGPVGLRVASDVPVVIERPEYVRATVAGLSVTGAAVALGYPG